MSVAFSYGNALRLTVFGSSHGDLVGSILDGFPAGFKVDIEFMKKFLDRRRPAQSSLTTQRKEKDIPEIVSGITDGYTDGGPVVILIRNEDSISSHYDEMKYLPRPGHGDLTLYYKYGDHRNYRGGGFLSGRMTAPLVAACSITTNLIGKFDVSVNSYIDRIGDILYHPGEDEVPRDEAYNFPSRIPDRSTDEKASDFIKKLMGEGDSTGGTIKTVVSGVPKGIGEPFFNSVESEMSHLMFSIPGVKGIEFGAGFSLASMKGSKANDIYFNDSGEIRTESNNNGGVLGGITNGMPVVFRVVMKPTSSIKKEQRTVNIATGKPDKLAVRGRHDPCIAIRAVPVVQTLASFVMADLMMQSGKIPRIVD